MNTIGSKIASHTRRLIIWQSLCVCIPLAATFLLVSRQAHEYETRYRAVFDETTLEIAKVKRDALQEKIAAVGAEALNLSTQASELFTYSDRFTHNATFYKEGDLYKNERGKPFAFYTPVELNQDSRKKASRLLLLSPLLESQAKSMRVSSGFVYLEDPFFLVYPPVSDVAESDGESKTIEPLYELFRKNPRKQWRLSLAETSKIAAPVFAGNRLIGVAGFELSQSIFEDILRDIPAPQNGFAFVADTQNRTILFGEVAGGFDERRYFEGSKQEGFKLVEESIEGMPITIVFGAPIAKINSEGSKLYVELMQIAALVAAFVALFYLIFVLRSLGTTKRLTQSIVRPLDVVARFSYRLGARKADRLEPMGITEFDDFANHMRLTHSKLLPPLTIDEATGLLNRRALLEDLDGKGPFGLIVVGVHLRCEDDALYIAAIDYALRRSGELIGRVIAGDDVIYSIGSNRLAVLTDKEDREALRTIARKIVDMIDNGSFEFNENKLEATAIFGVSSADKNVNGAKLVAGAEADLIKGAVYIAAADVE
jgi:GGDEF domain-containing protein